MKRQYIFAVAALTSVNLSACSWFLPSHSQHQLTRDVSGLEPQTSPGKANLPSVELPELPRGAHQLALTSTTHVPVQYSDNGKAYIPVEGLLSSDSFARVQANSALLKLNSNEKSAQIQSLLQKIVSKISAHAMLRNPNYAPEIGYFSAWVAVSDYSQLRNVRGLDADIMIAPRAQENRRPDAAKAQSARSPESKNTLGNENNSGIERLGVSQFLKTVESELGEKPTGQRVRVGVTDTGITYAHPAFRSSKTSQQRVTYMKDFTSEGAGFVSQRAALTIKRDASQNSDSSKGVPVLVTAQILTPDAFSRSAIGLTEGGAANFPFKNLTDEKFVLPEALVTALEAKESQVRLGVITEEAFASSDEKADINGNGRIDDSFYFFLFPSTEEGKSQVYIDFSGTRDFRKAKPLTDFNLAHETVDVLSEKIGLSLSSVEIPVGTDGANSETVTRVALVGFDPGNHGSHVSGIIGAQRTISNDSLDTNARGMAPEVELMMNRVCANNGGCNATRAIIDLARNGARVINMSLGGLSASNDGYGLQETVINRLTELYDVLFVISAGNSGPGRQTVGSPSTARHALSVAATATMDMISKQYQWPSYRGSSSNSGSTDDDFVLFFSSRGPTAAGGFKPNIAAPGTQLSTIQLNAANGSRSGLDVYWGTSMAAPAATGAIALLLDAAQIYNAKNPDHPMPTDALTIRRVILDSARPFRVNSFNPKTGASSKGIYTWIDQGYGMVSLPQAWELLKKKSMQTLSSGVVLTDSKGASQPQRNASLDYQVRVLRSLGNGLTYDGSQTFDSSALGVSSKNERKFGQGVWLTEKEADNIVEVHFNRNLRLKDLGRDDVGDLLRQLNTSAESFDLETTYYGSKTAWLKVGVSQAVTCVDEQESSSLTILGAGAVDAPSDGSSKTTLNTSRASALNLCLRKDLMSALPPGDHGAIIRAYKVVDGQRDVTASFEIPVYLTMPHHSTTMQAEFSITKQINSFGVDRHYVRVPKGVSVLRVSLDVPKASGTDAGASCSGVSLMVLAGGNTRTPADLAKTGTIAQSCSPQGAPVDNKLIVKFSEMNPLAGMWDLHVFGRYQFPVSTYSLNIDYATFAETRALDLNEVALASGDFPLVLKESTFDAVPDASQSQFNLSGLRAQTRHEISQSQGKTVIPSATGQLARTYAQSAQKVVVSTTSKVANLDIDMVIDECDDEGLKTCRPVAQSGTATADERGEFQPKVGKFYAVRIDPFDVPSEKAEFFATEIISLQEPESGRLRVSADGSTANQFKVNYAFEAAQSKLLADPLYTDGRYEIAGEVKLLNSDGIDLVHVPVTVRRK